MKMKKGLPARWRGFTLMELLIVVAIIGILASIAMASYITAQKKGRDSRRINNLKEVQSAWEQYYADNNSTYPATCGFSVTPTPGVMSGVYLPVGYPIDPKSGSPYPSMYAGWSSCTATSYCFCAGVEVAGSTNATTDCAGGTAPTGYSGLFCVHNLQ